MDEYLMEKLLCINTSRVETRMDAIRYYNRYEPTPYSDLNLLFSQYEIREEDHIVDFGSGKGRISFFVNYYYNTGCTSVEIVNEFHQLAVENFKNYKNKHKRGEGKLFYVNQPAQDYEIGKFENKFYFFNPFACSIFISIINKIIESVDEFPRIVDIILYYPNQEYIDFLDRYTAFSLYKEVYTEKRSKNPREKFSIYRLGENLESILDDRLISLNYENKYGNIYTKKQNK